MVSRALSKDSDRLFVFGLYWPEVDGVVSLCNRTQEWTSVTPYYFDDFSSLISDLKRFKSAKVILILPPRNYAYLLYSLVAHLPDVQAMILGDRFYHSDRIVLSLLGFLAWRESNAFLSEYRHIKSSCFSVNVKAKEKMEKGKCEVSLIVYMNNYLLRNLRIYQLTPTEHVTLIWVSRGLSLMSIGRIMSVNVKTVSSHKLSALKKLPHGSDRCSSSIGLRINSHMGITLHRYL